jgi:hypothetical protein
MLGADPQFSIGCRRIDKQNIHCVLRARSQKKALSHDGVRVGKIRRMQLQF